MKTIPWWIIGVGALVLAGITLTVRVPQLNHEADTTRAFTAIQEATRVVKQEHEQAEEARRQMLGRPDEPAAEPVPMERP